MCVSGVRVRVCLCVRVYLQMCLSMVLHVKPRGDVNDCSELCLPMVSDMLWEASLWQSLYAIRISGVDHRCEYCRFQG